jgi:hypothetical protein
MNPEFDSSNKFETEYTRQVEKLPGILGYNPAELDPRLPELRAEAVNAMAERDSDTIGQSKPTWLFSRYGKCPYVLRGLRTRNPA